MTGKIVEINGETYILSDDIELDNLDTNALVDEFVKQPEVYNEKNYTTVANIKHKNNVKKIPVIFTFFLEKNNEVIISGYIKRLKYKNKTIILKFNLEIIDALKLFELHINKKYLYIKTIKIFYDEIENNISFLDNKIYNFSITKFINNKANCKMIFTNNTQWV